MMRLGKWVLLGTGMVFFLLGCKSAEESSVQVSPVVEKPTETALPTPVPTARLTDPKPTETLKPTETPLPTEVVFIDRSVDQIPVIISHGGAPCDIGAMAYLVEHPNVELIGMLLSRGEIYPEVALDYWPIYLYDVLGATEAALGLGTDLRLDPNSSDFPASWRALASQFWNLSLPEKEFDYEPEIGHELIIELVKNSPKKVTILAMASMVDVALALQEDPSIIDNISQVVIMGGAFTVPGNLDDAPYEIDNQVAEWNIWIDAEAARVLFQSGVPVSIVPLDGIQYLVDSDDIAEISEINHPGVKYVEQMWKQQISWGGPFLIWNTIAVTAVTNPEYFHWIYDGVDVITEPGELLGQTIPLHNDEYHTRYATGADYEAIMELVFDVFRADAPEWKSAAADTSAQRWSNAEGQNEVIIDQLGGIWEGFTGVFHITFTINSECQLHQVCGTFEIPEFSLTGDISFTDIQDHKYVFRASNMSYEVEEAEFEYLEIRKDGRLNYVTQGSSHTSQAVLEKK